MQNAKQGTESAIRSSDVDTRRNTTKQTGGGDYLVGFAVRSGFAAARHQIGISFAATRQVMLSCPTHACRNRIQEARPVVCLDEALIMSLGKGG